MSSEEENNLLRPQVFGRYCLLERLSTGGMAEIFKARPFYAQDLRRYLVVKRILPHLADDTEFITMFVDEARLTIELSHPNVCQLYELGLLEGSYYIVMEYIGGRDVLSIINWFRKNRTFLTTELVAFIIAEVCAGLDYAHQKRDARGNPLNVVHRDISPQNVLVGYDGAVKVIDFGIARAASRRQRTEVGVLKGKFGYMSPEQVRGEELDQRSDIFATGILLWEMLTARRLFYAKNEYDILERVRSMDVPAPSSINSAVPPELDAIVFRALEREKSARYQHAGDMERDLREWLDKQVPTFGAAELAKWMRTAYGEEMRAEARRNEDFDVFQRPRDVVLYLKETEQPVPDEIASLDPSGRRLKDEELSKLETQVTSSHFELLAENSNQKVPKLIRNDAPKPVRRTKKPRGFVAGIMSAAAVFALIGAVLAFSNGSLMGARTRVAHLEVLVPPIEGVQVFLDGIAIEPVMHADGNPRWYAPELLPGQHNIRVRAEGFVASNEVVFVQAGQEIVLPVQLAPVEPEIMDVRVALPRNISGLKVAINGELRSSLDEFTVPLGKGETFLFEAGAPGVMPVRQFVGRDVKSGVFVPEFREITAQLVLSSDPESEVWVNDSLIGTTQTPLALTGLDPFKVQTLSVRPIQKGFLQHDMDFAFDGGFQRQIHVPLRRLGQQSASVISFGTVRFVGGEFYLVQIDDSDIYFATGLGQRDLGIPAGVREIRLLRGEQSIGFTVDVQPGKTETIRVPSYEP